jgi:hypothetical protein
MTDSERQQQFEYRNRATGEVIAVGPLSFLESELHARKSAEGAIRAAALAASRLAADTARADALDARQRDLEAREDAAVRFVADALDRLQRDALKLVHRVDEFERRRVRAEIDSLPDPEAAGVGDLQTILPPPEDEDREHLESMLSKERGDADAEEPAGELPAPMLMEVPAQIGAVLKPPEERADSFVCRRDRKAARRAWIREQRQR